MNILGEFRIQKTSFEVWKFSQSQIIMQILGGMIMYAFFAKSVQLDTTPLNEFLT